MVVVMVVVVVVGQGQLVPARGTTAGKLRLAQPGFF